MEVDRISVLPEPILHHILNFLLTKDAIQIAPTCKRLNQVWNTLPYLNLGQDFFPIFKNEQRGGKITDGGDEDMDHKNIEDEEESTNDIKTKREKLFTFVEQSLRRRMMLNLTIFKFQLRWTKLDVEVGRNLDGWINYLVHCNINELVLEGMGSHDEDKRYKLPPILLTAPSLRVLSLSCCSLPLSSVTLSALQKLRLVYVSLHEKILSDIINACPYLEELKLLWCSGLPKRISLAPPRHSRLRALTFRPNIDEEVDEVVIEAYNLEKLWFMGTCRPIKLNIITNSESSLKFLHLSRADITNSWFCELISRLSCLEELHLSQLNLKAIEILSSSLRRLKLSRVFHYADIRFGEFKIDTPNLVSLIYEGSLSSVFQNSMAVKEVRVNIDDFKRNRTNEHLCSDLMQFLHKFDYSEVVTLECTLFEFMIFPLEMRSKLHTPLAHIKHLILEGGFRQSPLDILAELFEGVRWIAPNLDSLSLKRCMSRSAIELIKITAGQCDCSTSPSECLKKCRSRIKFEVKGVGVEVGAVRNYLCHGDFCNPWNLK